MIEKQCGPIPLWMAQSADKQLKASFLKNGQTIKVDSSDASKGHEMLHEMRLNWPACKMREGSHLSWLKMKTLDQLVQHEHSHYHRAFLDLI